MFLSRSCRGGKFSLDLREHLRQRHRERTQGPVQWLPVIGFSGRNRGAATVRSRPCPLPVHARSRCRRHALERHSRAVFDDRTAANRPAQTSGSGTVNSSLTILSTTCPLPGATRGTSCHGQSASLGIVDHHGCCRAHRGSLCSRSDRSPGYSTACCGRARKQHLRR
jgi:hypothetical protein